MGLKCMLKQAGDTEEAKALDTALRDLLGSRLEPGVHSTEGNGWCVVTCCLLWVP